MWSLRSQAGKDVQELLQVMLLSLRGRKIWRLFSNGTSGGYLISHRALMKAQVHERPHVITLQPVAFALTESVLVELFCNLLSKTAHAIKKCCPRVSISVLIMQQI